MPSDPQRVQAIFIDAVQKSESERAEFLERECGGDSELRGRVDALIAAHDQSGSFLDSPPKDLAGTNPTIAHSMPEQAGSLIGPFKLLQQIGEGGMGSVYMAEQIEPVERRVALKIIKPGMDTKTVIARFEAERQALAMMDHPNIAKVLDVGMTNSGRPYFVMELVRGVPITQYCDEHQLTPRERLELFLPVCQAVQHAHQKGIIHRDIKPSNVLVAEYDDRPVPKIIDFGLAKAMEKRLTAKTMFTEFGQIVGTPDYMSPEQAKLNQMDIDTRSDIYSLGVLLYELLSGNTPFDRQRLRSAAFDELLRIIREEEPPKPSQRLSTVDTLPSIAANRHITPAELTRQLSGELDWIVMKTLEKDRSRRYETANGLAADLRRYLNDEPVEACPPSTAYRFRKFARRNKAPIAMATAVSLGLLLLVVGSLVAANRFRDLAAQRKTSLVAETRAKNEAREAQLETEFARAEEERLRIEAQQERNRAEKNKVLAEQRELLARRNLYTAHMNLAKDALEKTEVGRANDFLQRHVPALGEPDWRSFEWYYLAGLCNRDELTIQCKHSAHRPAFSPDGNVLAACIYRTQIEFWDLDRRERIQVIEDNSVDGPLAFSPDGKTLASAGKGAVKLWDVESGKHIRSMNGHRHHILSLAFTPDGSRIVSTDGGDLDVKKIPAVIRVWAAANGELLHELEQHTKYSYSIAISPDGNQLVSVGDGELLIWDLQTGQQIENLAIAGEKAVAWSPNGDSIASTKSGTIRIWDHRTGKETSRFKASGVSSLAYSPDGNVLAAAHGDGKVRLWEVTTGNLLASFVGHSEHWVFHVVFSPDGQHIASVARDMQLKVWPVRNEDHFSVFSGAEKRFFMNPACDRVTLSRDGKFLAGLGEQGKSVVVVDFPFGRQRAQLEIDATVNDLDFSSDGQHIAVASSGGLQVWNWATADPPKECEIESAVQTLAFSPDGEILAAGTDSRKIELFEAKTLRSRGELPREFKTTIRKISFSADGNHLAVATTGLEGQNSRVELCDLRQRRFATIEKVDAYICDLKFSADGKRLAVSEGEYHDPINGAATRLFDVTTGKQTAVLRCGGAYAMGVAFPSGGDTIATANEHGRITVWDLNTHEERLRFGEDSHEQVGGSWNPNIESIIFSRDGRTLISSDGRAKVRLWPTIRDDQVERIERAALSRRGQEYVSDGRWQEAMDLNTHLLQLGEDRTVRWNRAVSLAELGRWEEAVADFEKLRKSEDSQYRRWYELALAQLAKGDQAAYHETCIGMLDQFRETKNLTTAEFVCWTLSLAPRTDIDWGTLLALAAELFYDGEPSMSAHRTLGAVQLRAGLFKDAVATLTAAEQAVERNQQRTSPDYNWYLLAIAHAKLGNFDQARAFLNRTQPLNDGQNDAVEGDAAWFRRATLGILRSEALGLLDTQPRTTLAANVSDRSQSLNRALSIYSRAIELQPKVPMLYRLRADVLEQLNQTKDSADDAARSESLSMQFPLRRLNRLVSQDSIFRLDRIRYCLDTHGDFDKALHDCHVLLQGKEKTKQFQLFNLLFEIHAARGTVDVAHEQWPRFLGQRPPAEFYLERSKFYRQRGELSKAEDDAFLAKHPESYIDLAADDSMAWIHRGRWYMQRGEKQKAEADFAKAASLTPNELNKFLQAGWWVAGPFSSELSDSYRPEIDPDPSKPVPPIDQATGVSIASSPWLDLQHENDGFIHPEKPFGGQTDGSVYALAYVFSPDERTEVIRVDRGSTPRVWWNGRMVMRHNSDAFHGDALGASNPCLNASRSQRAFASNSDRLSVQGLPRG